MEIFTATESKALNLKYNNKEVDAEYLRQNVCHILHKKEHEHQGQPSKKKKSTKRNTINQ